MKICLRCEQLVKDKRRKICPTCKGLLIKCDDTKRNIESIKTMYPSIYNRLTGVNNE